MASMKDIKRRKSSIQSTQQITKAMKLVSTVKLQKAKGRAEQTNPYFNYMYQTVSSMLAKSGNINHPYLKSGDSAKKAVVVITSNRGLAGGYNSNIVKLITGSDLNKEDLLIYAIGNKGREALERRGYHIELEDSRSIFTGYSFYQCSIEKTGDIFWNDHIQCFFCGWLIIHKNIRICILRYVPCLNLNRKQFDKLRLMADGIFKMRVSKINLTNLTV